MLSTKANVTDVSRTFDQVSKYLENRPTIQDLENQLEDKVTRDELQLFMSKKVGIDEVKSLVDDKANSIEFKRELNNLFNKYNDLSTQLNDLQRISCTRKEYDLLREALETKVSMSEFNDQLNTKASKQSVSNALHRKANKSDLNVSLSQKAEVSDLTTLQQLIESKVDMEIFEKQIKHLLETRVERQELFSLKESLSLKVDKNQCDNIFHNIKEIKSDVELKLKELNKQFDNIIQTNNENFERINYDMKHKQDGKEVTSRMNQLELNYNRHHSEIEVLKSRFDNLDKSIDGRATVEEVREALKELKTD